MAASATPATLPALLREFADAGDFYEWLAGRRWGNEFICPKCHGDGALCYDAGLRRCTKYRVRVSPLSGSALGQFRGPHDVLLVATWSLAEGGTISAKRLSASAGVAYGSALLGLRKIRVGLLYAQEARAPELDGDVEVDEAYIGGSNANTGKRGRSAMPTKHLIVWAVERGQGGRCVMRRRERATKAELRKFIGRYIVRDSTLHTDLHVGYADIDAHGYTHHSTQERFEVLWDELLAAPYEVKR